MSDFLFVKKTTKKNNDFNLEIVMFIYWDVAYNFKNVLFVFLKSIIFLKIFNKLKFSKLEFPIIN